MGSKITQFVKSNLTLVITGALAVLSITMIALGFVLPNAKAELQADQAAYSSLQGIAGKAANDRVIEDVRRKQIDIRRNVQAFLTAAAKSTPRTLLHPDIFPEVKERFDANEFKDRADQKRRELLAIPKSGDQPSQQDIVDYGTEVAKAKQQEALQAGKDPADLGLVPKTDTAMPFGRVGPGDTQLGGNRFADSSAMPENVTPEEWVKQDPAAGASIKRAQEIYMYATESSLDPRSLIADKYPQVELMWDAQISLWVQEDIIQVLARINAEAAAQLPEDQRWVAHLPIKRLLYIVCGDYVKSTAADVGGFGRPAPQVTSDAGVNISDPVPPAPTASFTGRQASETLDVLPVAVGLVIDANALVRVMDEISKSGFYTTLSVNYEVVPYDPTLRGYIYGPGPVIRVRLELEHCILRDKLTIGDKKYVDLMPATIKSGSWVNPNRSGGSTPNQMMPQFNRSGFPGGPSPSRFRDEG